MGAELEFFYRLESWSLIQERALSDNVLSRTQGLLALKDRFEPVVAGNYLESTYLRGLRLIVGGIGGFSFERTLRTEFLGAVQRMRYRAEVWRHLLLSARADSESAKVFEYGALPASGGRRCVRRAAATTGRHVVARILAAGCRSAGAFSYGPVVPIDLSSRVSSACRRTR